MTSFLSFPRGAGAEPDPSGGPRPDLLHDSALPGVSTTRRHVGARYRWQRKRDSRTRVGREVSRGAAAKLLPQFQDTARREWGRLPGGGLLPHHRSPSSPAASSAPSPRRPPRGACEPAAPGSGCEAVRAAGAGPATAPTPAGSVRGA